MRNKPSYNARIGAVVLLFSSLAVTILTFVPQSVAPLRLFTLMLMMFSVWAFCDEMGLRKPLNRAGFVLFGFAILARSLILIDISSPDMARRYILYAFSMTGALLFWSAALLHREKKLKIVGAFGAAATLVPIAMLIIGHIAVGAGAAFGITSIFEALENPAKLDTAILNIFDYLFAVWGIASSVILWRGLVSE